MNSAGGTIAAIMEASVAGTGSGNLTNTLSSTWTTTGTDIQIVENPWIINPVTGESMSGGQTVVSTPIYGWVDTLATSTYNDTYYASGAFTAKLGNSYPNQIFKGKGSIAFTAIDFSLVPPALATTTVPISVKGSRISNTAQTFTGSTAEAPSIITTTSTQNRTN